MIPALIIILILFTVSLIYLILTPIDISYKYDFTDKRGSMLIKFFPLKFSESLRRAKRKKAAKVARTELVKPSVKKKKRYNWKILLDEFEYLKIMLTRIFEFLYRLAKFPDRYHLDAVLSGGVISPDITGCVYGGYQMMKPGLDKLGVISFKPDFYSESLTGSISVGLKFRMAILLKELLIFSWKLPKLKTIGVVRKLRKGTEHVE